MTCCYSNIGEMSLANAGVKNNSQKSKIIKIIQCGDIDETVIHISERRELAEKEYKTRHDWLGRLNWELCNKFKFLLTTKGYVCQPESVL